jgi:CBS domain-containing protein
MAIGEICKREVISVTRETTINEADRIMRKHHVGNVIVIKEEGERRRPIGIVTDRDVLVEVVATGLDPAVLTVGDIMVGHLAIVQENTGVYEAICHMRDQGVRRMPVMDKDGNLVGILTLDDLLELLALEMGALANLMSCEQKKEIKTRH